MFQRTIFKVIFFTFLIGQKCLSSEEGMPQLNPEFWVSQIFWLVLIFGSLYFLLSKFIIPKISHNLETRKSQIVDNIESAEKQRKESEEKIKEYEKVLKDSNLEAKNIFSKERERILKDINKKKEVLENEINKEIKKAEKEILELKNSSQKKINAIAIEISSNLINQIIDIKVNSSSISAIVEDVAKKREVKIYDN